jgi:hypothetical protein
MRGCDGLGASGDLELPKDRAEMALDGDDGDVQPFCNAGIRQPAATKCNTVCSQAVRSATLSGA